MSLKKIFFISIIFTVLIIIMTYPLITRVGSYMPGFFSTDESYAICWTAWFNKIALDHRLSLSNTDFISYPFGLSLIGSSPLTVIWSFINFSLAVLTTPILTYNIQILLNFFLVAFCTYLLVFYLTENFFSSFLSSLVFAFCPYMFARSWQHLGETYLWVMPLFLWLLMRLRNEDSLRLKVSLVLCFILTTVNYGVTYYVCIIFGLFCAYLLVVSRKEVRYLKKILLLVAVGFLFLTPQLFPIFKNVAAHGHAAASARNSYYRPFEDLFEQSARPLSYFLPAAVHPVFGKFTEQFIGSSVYGMSFTEHTLYLGWVPLILAFVGFRVWKRRRKLRVTSYELRVTDQDNFYIGFFVSLTIVAWLFSQPPWWKIGPLKIYMPSFFMYKILPMFRAYCRFGAVVMLAVSVLAGFGLKFILQRFKSKRIMVGLTAVLCILVLFEFWNYPPYKVIDLSKFPAVYDWLKKQPENIVIAEYPLDARDQSELYKLYQIRHEKKMINASARGTYANNIALSITQLSDPYTAGVLKWLGVIYVLVHQDRYLNTELIVSKEEFSKISENPGLKLIKSFPAEGCISPNEMCIKKTGPVNVYEVVALAIKPEATESP